MAFIKADGIPIDQSFDVQAHDLRADSVQFFNDVFIAGADYLFVLLVRKKLIVRPVPRERQDHHVVRSRCA